MYQVCRVDQHWMLRWRCNALGIATVLCIRFRNAFELYSLISNTAQQKNFRNAIPRHLLVSHKSNNNFQMAANKISPFFSMPSVEPCVWSKLGSLRRTEHSKSKKEQDNSQKSSRLVLTGHTRVNGYKSRVFTYQKLQQSNQIKKILSSYTRILK